ncbi:MAG: hypothetical protein ACRCV6_01540 [Formosimonas sp.]
MKALTRNTLLTSILGTVLATNIGWAQETHMDSNLKVAPDFGVLMEKGDAFGRACKGMPQNLTLTAQKSNTPTITAGNNQHAPDFSYNVSQSTFSQTATDQGFGYTFKVPTSRNKHCQYTSARLTVTYQALSSGPANSSTAANDGGGPVQNGVLLDYPGPLSDGISSNSTNWFGIGDGYDYIWGNSAVTKGQSATRVYTIPASWISTGRVSLYAQDDTAVVRAVLQLHR